MVSTEACLLVSPVLFRQRLPSLKLPFHRLLNDGIMINNGIEPEGLPYFLSVVCVCVDAECHYSPAYCYWRFLHANVKIQYTHSTMEVIKSAIHPGKMTASTNSCLSLATVQISRICCQKVTGTPSEMIKASPSIFLEARLGSNRALAARI